MTRVAWAFAVGVMLTAGVGCYHPRPYPPNYGAYPTYPSYQGVPPAGYPAAPGGPYIVPGQTIPGGTLGPTTTPYPTPTGPTLAPSLNGGGNAPPATYAPGSEPAGGAVPNYDDPNAGDFGNAPSSDGFQPPAEETPFMNGTAVPQPSNYAGAASPAAAPDYFAELSDYGANPSAVAGERSPASGVQQAGYEQQAAGARPGPLGTAAGSPAGSQSDWYGYDRNGYRWLRGVLNFDSQAQEWFIMYGLPPEEGERYGGALTLTNHPSLADFKNNDVVEVRGRIDPTAGADIQGKPYYRVESVKLLGRYE